MNKSVRTDLDYLEARAGYVVPKVALRVIAYYKKRWKVRCMEVASLREEIYSLGKEKAVLTSKVTTLNDFIQKQKYLSFTGSVLDNCDDSSAYNMSFIGVLDAIREKQIADHIKLSYPLANPGSDKYDYECGSPEPIKPRTGEDLKKNHKSFTDSLEKIGEKNSAAHIKFPDYTTNPGGDKYNEDLAAAIKSLHADRCKESPDVDEIKKNLQKLGYGYMSWDSCKKWSIFVHGVNYSTEGFTFRQSWFDTELSAYQSAYDVIKK